MTNPSLKYTNLITYKGGSRKIAVNGTVDGSSMSFTSKNASMAAVTATGVIKAKKTGHVKVVANVDGKNITANVEIASAKAYNAAKKRNCRFQRQRQDTVRQEECQHITMTAVLLYGEHIRDMV